jgi:hypothetical protein
MDARGTEAVPASVPERALIDFIVDEVTSLVQVLRMAAESNEATAIALEAEDAASSVLPGVTHPAWPDSKAQVAEVMRESAEGWRRKAVALSELYAALPESDNDDT